MFKCYPLNKLISWVMEGADQGNIFGISSRLFFDPNKYGSLKTSRYGQTLETPIGVAAGPHTQLAVNIISAWLTGARYIELKTIQTLDELDIKKPCINMEDEGYNCEWSQELKIEDSFQEYFSAWIILHILKDRLWGSFTDPGFIFNMSVGYNLEGILKPNVQNFLDKMSDCSKEIGAAKEFLVNIYPKAADIDIKNQISDNLTVSTMHGCPPDEIEKICRYFIETRKLNTTVKLNPTLLGPDNVRKILNDDLRFNIDVPNSCFEHDLKYKDAVKMIENLEKAAKENNVSFGLKLTNTLECVSRRSELPEKITYMSGRSLHPITVNLAKKLQDEFGGRLDISFAGGANCFNVSDILACKMEPVTVCSDILKPGGYARLRQYIDEISKNLDGLDSIDSFILKKGGGNSVELAGLENLRNYAAKVSHINEYHKLGFPFENIKTDFKLNTFDCIHAPCISACPLCQDIPSYIYYTKTGDYEKAFEVITQTNPFPNLIGQVCHKPCITKCTRINYDSPLKIREIKDFIASRFKHKSLQPKTQSTKVAIIGAGPSGLACAYFLAKDGFKADIYESRGFAGGMAKVAIPDFRLNSRALKKDIDNILSMGLKINFNCNVDQKRLEEIKKEYDYVYIAIGAQKGIKPGLAGSDIKGVFDHIDFLESVRAGSPPVLGKKGVIIGGGNSAIDTARTAKRLTNGDISILYRRTRELMPADNEEVKEALQEGIELIELSDIDQIIEKDGKVKALLCCKTKLEEPAGRGRPKPVKIPSVKTEIAADFVIFAIGQKVDSDFGFDITKTDAMGMTSMQGVFAGGDAVRGPANLVLAAADGRKAAYSIKKMAGFKELDNCKISENKAAERDIDKDIDKKRGQRIYDLKVTDEKNIIAETSRCLDCALSCNTCVTVCPNRANVSYKLTPIKANIFTISKDNAPCKTGIFEIKQEQQVINIADFCNECGNCATFCPTSGRPYIDKPRFYLSRETWDKCKSGMLIENNTIYSKQDDKIEKVTIKNDSFVYQAPGYAEALFDIESFELKDHKVETDIKLELSEALKLCALLKALKDFYLFK